MPCSLERSDFLDTEKRPFEYSAFKELVEAHDGRLYTDGVDAYLCDMAQPVHLNFERSLLRSLLPTAMSFTFVRDLPRLSIDIDLTYVPIADRATSLKAIDAGMKRIADAITKWLSTNCDSRTLPIK